MLLLLGIVDRGLAVAQLHLERYDTSTGAELSLDGGPVAEDVPLAGLALLIERVPQVTCGRSGDLCIRTGMVIRC